MFQAVWCSEENRDEALGLLDRIPAGELARRNCRGIRRWQQCPIPTAEGRQSGQVGDCVATDAYGSVQISPGSYRAGILLNMQWLELSEVKPGLVGATIRPEFWDQPSVAHAAESQQRMEQKLSVEDDPEEQAGKVADALRRLYSLGARSLGIGADTRMTDQEIEDAYVAALMSGGRLPQPDAWVRANCPEVGQKPRSQYDGMNFWEWSEAVRGSLVERTEKKAS